MDNEFGQRLTTLRTGKRITQEDLAIKMNVSRQAISKWERGTGLPDLYNIQRLASILGVSVDYLINGQTKQTFHQQHTENVHATQGLNFIKTLLYKAKHTTNSAQAKKIKNYLLIGGGIGVLTGIIMVIAGFYGFANGAFNSVNDFGSSGFPSNIEDIDGFQLTTPKPFNPIPYMLLFMSGGIVSGISMYAVYAGLAITVANVTTNFLDTRDKCPQCGDEIDDDEDVCSSCGFKLKEHQENVCVCGKIHQAKDKFCRRCGLSVD